MSESGFFGAVGVRAYPAYRYFFRLNSTMF